ncbi:MAG: M3 family oligoendopeptidase [Alphaproteobacteria bacterium]|nr:M3 family oligoendopeptidase [Alphaproteobacteria bacterium]
MPDSLPIWNLADLYQGSDDPLIGEALAGLAAQAEQLAQAWQGKLASASGAELAGLIADYETVSQQLGRILSHADLMFAADMTDPAIAKHSQTMREKASDIEAKLLFVELELAALDEAAYQAALADPAFFHYQPWLRQLRASAPHILEARLEQMLVERGPAGRTAWVRLFDETATQLKFDFDDQQLSEAEILNLLTSSDSETRRKAGQSLSQVMQANQRLFGLIINTIAKDKEVEDRWRKFSRPVSSRNLANDVDDPVVDALAAAVTGRMPDLSHRYYTLKAGWAGQDQLDWWDRNAPLPGDDDRRYSWQEAQKTVLDAFAGFSPQMAELASRFFEKGWIDAPIRSGKASGAFAHPTVPQVHPYILLNYDGKARDVMTLAHELGHGIHQLLAADKGLLMSQTPLTLAETASVFAEMLVFRHLLDNSPASARKYLLAGKVEDMLNTVVRQIAFHNFETRLHDARRTAELSSEEICDLWMETQEQALGPAIRLGESYRPIWAYIPHFIHTPFYVYAYAFGDCLVNALWQTGQQASGAARDHFVTDYLALLKAGGSQRYDAALAPFGLDPADPAFWHRGLDMIAGLIDELEELS